MKFPRLRNPWRVYKTQSGYMLTRDQPGLLTRLVWAFIGFWKGM